MQILLSILIVMFASCSFAQQPLASRYIGWKSPKIELQSIGNKQQTCTVLMREDSIRVYQSDAMGTLNYYFGIARKVNENFLGGFFKAGELYLFLDNGNDPGIHSFSYKMASRELSEHNIPFAIKKEHIIQRLSSDHYFFYLTIDKESPEFVLYQFGNEKTFVIHRFTASASILKDISQSPSGPFSKVQIDVQQTDMEGECDLMAAKCRQKIYMQGDSLFLLLNNVNGRTQVYTFDLEQSSMDNRIILHQPIANKNTNESSNSFLLRNKLYYVSANPDSLLLQVCNIHSGELLQQFTAFKAGKIDFMNTVATVGDRATSRESKDFKKTAPLLKKLNRKQVAITATADDVNDEVQVMIGFFELVNSYGGGGMAMNGIGVGGGPSFGFMPGGFTSNWTAAAHFKTRLHAATAEHIVGELPYSINEKIDNYTDKINIPKQGENLIRINEAFHYIFYDRGKRMLSAVLFN